MIIGDSMVGKTSFLLRYTDDHYSLDHMATIGLNFKVKVVSHQDREIRLQIWDTAGQERFKIMAPTFYKGAKGIVLAYDCTSESSFRNIENWVREISLNSSADIPKVLVATKTDLAEQRVIKEEMGRQLAAQLDMHFFETSAALPLNIHETFAWLVEEIMGRPSSVLRPESVSVLGQTLTPDHSGCCSSKKKKSRHE